MTRRPLIGSLIAATAAVLLVISGCSTVRIGYGAFPTWASWQINKYLSLDDQQQQIARRHVEKLAAWHRRHELPRYRSFLESVEQDLQGDRVPPGELDAALAAVGRWRPEVTAAWTPVAERLAPGVAELGATLRPEQIERMKKRMDESNDDMRREMKLDGSAQQRLQARIDRWTKRAESFFGNIGDEQRRHIRQHLAFAPAGEEVWYAERVARQARIVGLFESLSRDRPAADWAIQVSRDTLVGLWQDDPQRNGQLEAVRKSADTLSAQLLAMATPKQREHMVEKLRGYAADAQALALAGE